jgi:hypothetical protein
MTRPSFPTRRAFLQRTLYALVGVAVAGGCARDRPSIAAALAEPALLSALGATRVREIGLAYLRATPTESTAPALRSAIAQGARQQRRRLWSPDPSLDALIAADFTEGRVVFPAGWMLSVNEARQCALFALQG